MSGDCGQELCVWWSGDGRVCPCAIFGLEQPACDHFLTETDGMTWVCLTCGHEEAEG